MVLKGMIQSVNPKVHWNWKRKYYDIRKGSLFIWRSSFHHFIDSPLKSSHHVSHSSSNRYSWALPVTQLLFQALGYQDKSLYTFNPLGRRVSQGSEMNEVQPIPSSTEKVPHSKWVTGRLGRTLWRTQGTHSQQWLITDRFRGRPFLGDPPTENVRGKKKT